MDSLCGKNSTVRNLCTVVRLYRTTYEFVGVYNLSATCKEMNNWRYFWAYVPGFSRVCDVYIRVDLKAGLGDTDSEINCLYLLLFCLLLILIFYYEQKE